MVTLLLSVSLKVDDGPNELVALTESEKWDVGSMCWLRWAVFDKVEQETDELKKSGIIYKKEKSQLLPILK